MNATTKDYQELSNAVTDCIQILKNECNIEMIEGFKYDFHRARALGRCSRVKKIIQINYDYFRYSIDNDKLDTLYNTIIHEMLHAVAESKQKNCGHTGLWRTLAQKVSYKTKYKIQRLAETSEEEYMRHKAKHIVKCADCGKEYYYSRNCDTVRYVKSKAPFISCGHCDGTLTLIK